MSFSRITARLVLALCAGSALLNQTVQAVEHGTVEIDAAGVVTIPHGTADLNLRGVSSTGLVPIQIGASATDDASDGVLLNFTYQSGRLADTSTPGTETLWASAATHRDASGLSLVSRRAGEDSIDTLFPGGASFDTNMSVGYFPFSEGWVGGTAYSTGGGTLDEFVVNGLTPANFTQDGQASGVNALTIPGVTDTQRQGILMVTGASDTNILAQTAPAEGGASYAIHTGLNNANGATPQSGAPVSFLFVPVGTPGVTMARIHPGNTAHPAENLIHSGDDVSLTRLDQGKYTIDIAGQSPSTGTLMINQHGIHDGAGGRSGDNLVTYEPNGAGGWTVLSEDLPSTVGVGQDANGNDAYFEVLFVPFTGGPSGPGAIPAPETLTNFNRSRIIGWNVENTPLTDGNSPGDMRADAVSGTSGLNISGIGSNKGDLHFYVDGAPLTTYDGVMFSTVREGLRDNTSVGGLFEYGVTGTQLSSKDWGISTAQADPSNGEHNIDVSVTFFGRDSGFQIAGVVPVIDNNDQPDDATLNVQLGGENADENGVLIVTAHGNDDNYVTSTPEGGSGSGWDLLLTDNGTAPEGNDKVNLVYLPYMSENLVAGHVAPDGTLVTSTDTNDFTLTKVGPGQYDLTIPGKSPSTGSLLLSSTSESGGDNSIVYEDGPGSSFRILGLDMITSAESGEGELVFEEDTGFSFAYIDFENPPIAPRGDMDGDGDYDVDDINLFVMGLTDFEGYQALNPYVNGLYSGDMNGDGLFNFGDISDAKALYSGAGLAFGSSAAVPEPTSAVLLSLAAIAFGLRRRRS